MLIRKLSTSRPEFAEKFRTRQQIRQQLLENASNRHFGKRADVAGAISDLKKG